MKKINIYLLLFLTTSIILNVFFTLSGEKSKNNEKSNNFHIPKTISAEAQEIIKSWDRKSRDEGAVIPKPDAEISIWEEAQENGNNFASKPLPELLEFYKPKIDTIFINGVRVIDVKPNNYVENKHVIIYIHGGAYVFFTADVTLLSSVPLADATGLRILSIDYTLAPQANFKQIIDEVLKMYQGVLHVGYKAKNISIYGDSAGGGLAAGSVLKMRDDNIEMPSSLVLWSPWTDIDKIGDTYFTLAQNDPNLVYNNFLEYCAQAYAPKNEFKNPYVSPVYGDFSKDFPPTLIQVGGKETFLSNSIRMYRALDTAGKEVKLDVYEGMWHVWQGYYKIPESKIAIKNTSKFIFQHFSK